MKASDKMSAVRCDVCNVDVSSAMVMKNHVLGKRHQALAKMKQSQQLLAERSIFVRGFPFGTSEEKLKKVFSTFGEVYSIVLSKDEGAFALVEFNDNEAAQRVLKTSPNGVTIGGRHLTVKPRTFKPFNKVKTDASLAKKHLKNDDVKLADSELTVDKNKPKQKAEDVPSVFLKAQEAVGSIDDQISELVRWLELSEEDYKVRQNIALEIQRLCQETFPGCKVELFGSSANQLGIVGCDVDLNLDVTEDEQLLLVDSSTSCLSTSSSSSLSLLTVQNVARILRKAIAGCYTDVVAIPSARCPVVKFTHVATSLNCDISLNNRLAVRNTELIRYFVGSDERIRHLMYVVRHWAKVHGISGSRGAKLTNYALTLLIIFYLQTALVPPMLPSVEAMAQLSGEKIEIDGWDCSFSPVFAAEHGHISSQISQVDLLRGFFKFAAELDFKSCVICTRTGRCVSVDSFQRMLDCDEKLSRFKISSINIQDPFVLDHNTASIVNDKQYSHIIGQFKIASVRCHDDQFAANAVVVGDVDNASSNSDNGLVYLLRPTTMPGISQTSLFHDKSADQVVKFTFDVSKPPAVSYRNCAVCHNSRCDAWCRDVAAVTKAALSEILEITCTAREEPSDSLMDILQQWTSLQRSSSTEVDKCQSNVARIVRDSKRCDSGSDETGDDCKRRKIACELGTGIEQHKSLALSAAADAVYERLSSVVDDNIVDVEVEQSELVNFSAVSPAVVQQENCDRLEGDSLPMTRNASDQVNKLYLPSPAANANEDAPFGDESVCDVPSGNSKRTYEKSFEYLLTADCSAFYPLWRGRRKVRSQLKKRCSDEHQREVATTNLLKASLPKCDNPILNFEIVELHQLSSPDIVTVSFLPKLGNDGEFAFFLMYFKSLLLKLVQHRAHSTVPICCCDKNE